MIAYSFRTQHDIKSNRAVTGTDPEAKTYSDPHNHDLQRDPEAKTYSETGVELK